MKTRTSAPEPKTRYLKKTIPVLRDPVINTIVSCQPFVDGDRSWFEDAEDETLMRLYAWALRQRPDAYSKARGSQAPQGPQATDDANYQAHGRPASGYVLALTNRKRGK